MKNIITTLIFFCLFCTGISAQTGIHIGAHTGINVVGIIDPENYGGKELDYSAKYGFMYGGVVGFDFLKWLGLQAELNLAKSGHKVKGDGDEINIKREIDMDYLQIPVLAKVRSSGEKVRFYMLIGPQFSYLQSASITSTEANENVADAIENGNFTRNDIGILFGTGADMFLAKDLYLNLGIRLYYGLTDVNSDNDEFWATRVRNGTMSNNTFGGIELGLHYNFSLSE